VSVSHYIECLAHGILEARVDPKKLKCPYGCSGSFVKILYLEAPKVMSGRTKNADRMLKAAAASQGLSDVSTSPSRPGGSVIQRLRQRNQPEVAPTQIPGWGEIPAIGKILDKQTDVQSALKFFGGSSPLVEAGLQRASDPKEWQTGEDGKPVHIGRTTRVPDYKPAADVQVDPRKDL